MLLRRTSRPTAAAWRHIRGLSSWTNATVQEKLNSHPWVADCVVGDAEHIHGVSGNLAHVVPLFQTRDLAVVNHTLLTKDLITENFFSDTEPNAEKNYQESLLRYSNVDADGLNEYLRDGGYEGAALQVLWCTEVQLTNVFFHGYQRHERMVLRDIVYAMFAEADTDGDGSITLAEFAPLCEKYGVDISSFHNADLNNMESGDDYTLGFVGHLRLRCPCPGCFCYCPCCCRHSCALCAHPSATSGGRRVAPCAPRSLASTSAEAADLSWHIPTAG